MIINSKRKDRQGVMEMNPQGFNYNMSAAFDDFLNYHNSMSAHMLDMRATSAYISNFNTVFPDANIPQIDTYRPDLPMSDAELLDMERKANDIDPRIAAINEDISYKEKKEFIQNQVNKYLSSIPPSERAKSNSEMHFFEIEAEKARKSSRRLQTVNQFSESGFDRFVGTLVGGAGAGFTDPLILATLPISFTYGAGRTFAGTVLKTAAAESVLAAGATIGIESQVLPFKQSVGIDYDINDAAKIVLFSTIAGAVIPVAFLGGAKGTAIAYGAAKQQIIKGVAELNPDLKAKLFVEENFPDFSDEEWVKYFAQNLNNLKPNELVIVLETLNPAILSKPKVAEAVEDIKNLENDFAENPFPQTIEGTVEHNGRMTAASEALQTGDQPRILDSPTVPVVLKENRPVAYDTYLTPDQIKFDAETFQFKTGGDARGVKDTLAKVTQWDRDAAGSLMVYQKADGTYFVADGHQRLGLAKRLSIADPDANIIINTTVRREVDGFTPEEVMAEAMIRNVQNGTANPVDVARALRVSPEYINRMANKVAPNTSLYRLSTSLYKLSDDAWGYFLNSGINAKIAAAVCEMVDDPALHLSVMKVLEKTKPATGIELRNQIESILQAGNREVQTIDMFGTTTIKETLIVERGKVLQASLNKLKKDKTVMATLVQNEQRIIQDGKNRLDTTYNKTQEEQNAIAIYQIETLANRKGEVSDALTRSARLWADGNKREATETFIESIRAAIERGDTKGINASGDRRSAIVEGQASEISTTPKLDLEQKNLKNFEDPNKFVQSKKNADQELGALEADLAISSNNPEFVSGGAIKTSPTVKSLDASTQDDLGILQATTTDPSSSVFAKATATPASLIDETISIGSFNPIVQKSVLQHINDVDQLLVLAAKYQNDLESTLNNITIGIKNATIKTRVKEAKKAKTKVEKTIEYYGADAQYMGDYLGGRILVDTLEDVNKVFRAAREQDIKIVDIENYFVNTKDSGYRAIHFNMVTREGFSMEVQIQHKDLAAVFEQGKAYRKYKEKVKLTKAEEADRAKLAAEDKILFDETYNQIKQREGVIDDVDNIEIVVGEKLQGDEITNVTQTLKQFKDDVDNDNLVIGELIKRDCL